MLNLPLSSPFHAARLRRIASLAVLSLAVSYLSAGDSALRGPIPPPEKLKEAGTLIRDIFKDEFRKYAQQDQLALATKLLEQGLATKDDPAARYQLLWMAMELASRAGNLATALHAVDMLDASYQVESVKLKTKALSDWERSAKTKEQFLELVENYLVLAEEASAREDFPAASGCAIKAQQFARSAQDMALYAKATKRGQEYQSKRSAFEAVRSARDKLFEKPDDPEANFTLGKYVALVLEDWDKALPSLAKAGEAAWRSAATEDLAKPQEAKAQVQVADLWFELAGKVAKPEQDGLKLRAAYWYGQALPQLAGLGRAKVEKRLQEIQDIAAVAQARKGEALGPLGIGEATRKALPTEEELKKLKELAVAKRNGDQNATNQFYQQRQNIIQRLLVTPENCSDEDFKLRCDTENQLYALDPSSMGRRVAYNVYGIWSAFAGVSKSEAQFLKRAKEAQNDYGRNYSSFSYSSADGSPWDRMLRYALHQFLTRDAARYPSTAVKVQFCDWLKAQGISSPAVEQYKNDLLSGGAGPAAKSSGGSSGASGGGTGKTIVAP